MNMKKARRLYRAEFIGHVEKEEYQEEAIDVRTGEVSVETRYRHVRQWKDGAPGFRTWARKNTHGTPTGKLARIVAGPK